MKKNKVKPLKNSSKTPADRLRRKAEILSRKKKARTAAPTAPGLDKRAITHELQIHQIELQMQNDELIRANDALEKAKKKFEDIYDFSTICYFSLGRDGIIQGMNLSAANLLGNARSGLVGRNFRMFVSQGERRAFDGFLEKVFNNKIKTAIETILAGSGKSPANVYVEGAAGDDSSVCQLNLIDITERKQDEATIKSLVEKLEYSNEQLEAFAYTISHDLQSPIGSITGFITLIEKQNAGLMNED